MEQHLKKFFKKITQNLYYIQIAILIICLFFEWYNIYSEVNVNLFFVATSLYIVSNYFQMIKLANDNQGALPCVFIGSISTLGMIVVVEFLCYVFVNLETSIIPIKTPTYILYFVVFISEIYKLTIEYKPPSK